MFNISILFSLLSAVLLSLSFPKPELWFLAWFALVPWFFALQKAKPAFAFLLSYLVGVVFFSVVLYWVNYVSSLGFTVLVFYLALYFAFFGLLFSVTYRRNRIINLLFLPSVWVTLEYIRGHLFSGFGWALLGYSQYSVIPVIQISDVTGAYGVSFLLLLVNVAIWHCISGFQFSVIGCQKKVVLKKLFLPVFLVLFLFLATIGYGYFRLHQQPPEKTIKVATVQGNIPQVLKWDPALRDFILDRYILLTEQASAKKPQLIVWPETSVPGYLENDIQLLEQFASLSRKISPTYLLVGTPHQGEDRKIYNRATLFIAGEIIKRYDKLHLVPFGEFIPWPEFFSRFPFAGLIGDFTPGKEYTVFRLGEDEGGVGFSVLVCFEDVFPYLARRFVHKGARILLNITNDAWFEDSAEPYQHMQASVFRAVENRVNLIRSANTGVSCFINPWGKILSRVTDDRGEDLLVTGERTAKLSVVPIFSFYTAFGDIFAWFCLIITIITLAKITE